MASTVMCIITSSIIGKGAYGITTDTDEGVYVPVAVADALDLEEFETIEAVVIKNDRPEPPWRVIRARRPVKEDGATAPV